jgi:ATP-dependent RNA helicase DHX8/PRP22
MITVMQIHLSEPAGDILVFLTGQEEIDTCCETLFTRMQALGDLAPELIILPVYSALPRLVAVSDLLSVPSGARRMRRGDQYCRSLSLTIINLLCC